MLFKKGTKVFINLNAADAKKLGIAGPIVNKTGVVDGSYDNGVEGTFVKTNGKTMAIADKYEALTEIK